MKKVIIKLVNCYGIKNLDSVFDFSSKNFFTIYAPNGAMKSSFAKTFKDQSEAKDSEDRIFKDRKAERKITDETGTEINKDQIFVIESYEKDFKSSKISTLLVNKTLKQKYDQIYEEIDVKKELLLKSLRTISGLKEKTEETIANDISHDPKEFFNSIIRVQKEVEEDKSYLASISYKRILNDKVQGFLEGSEFKEKLATYMKIYDALIGNSTFFKKGIFNHNNAADIAKNLKDNGFFKANHSVFVQIDKEKKEVKTVEELEAVIQKEKDTILQSPELSASFNEVDKVLNKNKDTWDFRDYLEKNKNVLPELENIPRFKQKLWISYLAKSSEPYKNLLDSYSKGKEEIEKIISQAKKEITKWANVLEIFNERFKVPFEVIMSNQEDVILKSESPSIKFRYRDGSDQTDIGETDLWLILSQGEKRALYILNIIFEVQGRLETNQETLFIVDDIADSFDYKNKYAIIEYLNDVSKNPNFYQIILTHNYDFFRTINSRLNAPRENRLHTIKNETSTKLIEERYQKNPFTYWKENLATYDEMLIASIPFVRNLAEYCGYQSEYDKLTKLLHLKPDTSTITIGDLETTIKLVLKDKNGLTLKNKDSMVIDLLYSSAQKIFNETDEVIELEKKIVLSIAIRLKTEEYLINGINDNAFVSGISKNQTIELIRKYKELTSNNKNLIELAEQVNLMTPENIHINSFMYEPILDMSNVHLKGLYKKVFEFTKS